MNLVDLNRDERLTIILALVHFSLSSPAWEPLISEIASKFESAELFNRQKAALADYVQPLPPQKTHAVAFPIS